jgi:hypothetical protein
LFGSVITFGEQPPDEELDDDTMMPLDDEVVAEELEVTCDPEDELVPTLADVVLVEAPVPEVDAVEVEPMAPPAPPVDEKP